MKIFEIFRKKKYILVGDDAYIIDENGNKEYGKVIAVDKDEVLFNGKWIKIKLIHKNER